MVRWHGFLITYFKEYCLFLYFQYQYEYKVQDPEKSLYFGAQEAGNEVGRVEGSYQVLLPDGRLMTVTYYIEGESGFVPKISFKENANPFGSSWNW